MLKDQTGVLNDKARIQLVLPTFIEAYALYGQTQKSEDKIQLFLGQLCNLYSLSLIQAEDILMYKQIFE